MRKECDGGGFLLCYQAFIVVWIFSLKITLLQGWEGQKASDDPNPVWTPIPNSVISTILR